MHPCEGGELIVTLCQWTMFHINVLELSMVTYALISLSETVYGKNLLLSTDSMARKFNINKQWEGRLRMHIIIIYALGQDTALVDFFSRDSSSTHKWSIQRKYLCPILQTWGYPGIDLFFSEINTVPDLLFQGCYK